MVVLFLVRVFPQLTCGRAGGSIMSLLLYHKNSHSKDITTASSIHVEVYTQHLKGHCNTKSSLVPRPHPLRGEGSGDIGAISWSCTPSRDSIELNVLSHMNAELAQPRNRSNVTRPFSSKRVGSGDETTQRVAR